MAPAELDRNNPTSPRISRESLRPGFLRLKVWVAGCATGEAAYSLAVLLHEEGLLDRTQIYATDINPESLRIARDGVYAIDRFAKFSDSVFAEVQLASCRNVLIYFDRALQDRALGLLRDALCHRGFWGLGSRESLRFSNQAAAFREVVPEERIYQRL